MRQGTAEAVPFALWRAKKGSAQSLGDKEPALQSTTSKDGHTKGNDTGTTDIW